MKKSNASRSFSEVKRIDPMSIGRMMGLVYAILGFIGGAFFSILSVLGAFVAGPDTGLFAIVFGVGAIIIFPIMYGVMGFLGGIVSGWVYNIVADKVGGVHIELR